MITTLYRKSRFVWCIVLWSAFGATVQVLRAEELGEYLHYHLGVKYEHDKNYDRAIAEFRKALSDYPDNYNVYMRIAEIRMRQRQPRLAIADLKQALSHNPGWGAAHDLLAQAYVMDNQLQKAIEEYQMYQQSSDPAERDSIQRVIDRLVAHIGLGGMLRGDGTGFGGGAGPPAREIASVTGKKKSEIPLIPSDPKAAAAFTRAIAAYQSHSYDTALALLKKVIALQPGFIGAYYYGGLVRYSLGNYQLAKMNFAKGLGYPDPAHTGLLCLGKIYGEEEQFSDAIREVSRYSKLTNSNDGKKEAAALLSRYHACIGKVNFSVDSLAAEGAEAERPAGASSFHAGADSLLAMVCADTVSDTGRRLLAGIRECTSDRFDQAIREFKKTLTTYPTGVTAVQCIYNIGICYFKLRLYKEAENQFQQILDRYPAYALAAQAFFLKAVSYSERKETVVAERLIREFLRTYGRHAWENRAWEKLGDLYCELDQPKKAIDAFAHVIATEKTGRGIVKAYFASGVEYQSLANSVRAVACFDSAIAKGEKSETTEWIPESYYRAGDEKYKEKNFKQAISYYLRVTRKYPAFKETPWGLFQIGTIYKNLHNYPAAIETYKDLMQRFPNDYWAGQARWKLDDTVWEHEYQTTLQ